MKDVKLCILFTWEGDHLTTLDRTTLANVLLQLAKRFELLKVDFEPPLPDWDVRDFREEFQNI